jgi:hypothetical protein
VYDHIEEKQIPHHSSEECDQYRVDDSLFFSLGSIERTDPLRAKIPYKSYDETEESKSPKIPLVLSVKGICE